MKKRLFFAILLIFLFVFSLAFGGCEKIEKFEYASIDLLLDAPKSVFYTDFYASFKVTYSKKYESENARYLFEDGVEKDNANKIVTRAEKTIEYLKQNNFYPNKASFFVGDSMYNAYETGKAFLRADCEPITLVICLLQGQYDGYLPYGYFYAIAKEVCKATDIPDSDNIASLSKLKSYYKKETTTFFGAKPNLDTLDLEYPLFSQIYSDKETLKIAKGTAANVLDFIKKEQNEENPIAILKTLTSSNVVNHINDWLKSINIDKTVSPQNDIKYFSHNAVYGLKAETDWISMYFNNEFKESEFGENGTDYSNLKFWISASVNTAQTIRGTFPIESSFKTEIAFDPGIGTPQTHTYGVNCYSFVHFAHEYVHECCLRTGKTISYIRNFAEEAVPNLYRVKFDPLLRLTKYFYYTGKCHEVYDWGAELRIKANDLYNKMYGVDSFENFKLEEYIHIEYYVRGKPAEEINLNESYWQYNTSLALFVEEKYGFEVCCRLMRQKNFAEDNTQRVLGITEKQLVINWWKYLDDAFNK